MKDIQHLWKKRSGLFWREAAGYLRYVFNSGFLVFLMFTFIAGGYYYSRMINDIPKSFQSEWIISAILSFFVTFGSVRTFLKQADYVFLLPLEWKMAPYFRSSFLYSYVFRAFIVLFSFGLLQPLYQHRFSEGGLQTGYIFGMLLTLTFINLMASWLEQRIHDRTERVIYGWIRYVVSFIVMFLFLRQDFDLIFFIMLGIFLVPIPYYIRLRKRNLHWEHLLHVENNKQSRFYTVMNWFIDVPRLQNRIKERRWVPAVTRWLPFQQQSTYYYLYIKTMSRSNELLDMVIRLTVMSSLILILISHEIGQLIVIVITLLLSGVQLSTLHKHHLYTVWLRLYPASQIIRPKALVSIIIGTMLIQSIILSIIATIGSQSILIALGLFLSGSLLFSFLFRIFLKQKMTKLV